MSLKTKLINEIHELTKGLIRTTLLASHNFPATRVSGRNVEIGVGKGSSGVGFGNVGYSQIYEEVRTKRFFNFCLIDGGCITLQYQLDGEVVTKHRLAFWSSPSYEAFQNDPELYAEDDIYLEYLQPSLVPFPFRIDYDPGSSSREPVEHPACHITFGAYKNCRVPVSAPVGPATFVRFVLRNFYNTAYARYENEIQCDDLDFPEEIDAQETVIPHLAIRRA